MALLALLALAFPLLRPRLAPRPEQLLARCATAPAPEARASCYREELRRIAYRRAATPEEIGWLCLKVGDPECAKGFGAIARAYADCLEFARGYAGGLTACLAGLRRW